MAVPKKNSLLVPWSTNFSARATADPGSYGLWSEQASQYAGLHALFISAYEALISARANGVWSRVQTAAAATAKANLLRFARELYAFVQANTSVSDAKKIEIGVTPRSGGSTPVPPPGVRPGVDPVSAVGHTVTINIHDSDSSAKRGKPAGAQAAWVYTFIGAEYPSDPAAWTFHGSTTKAKFDIVFPSTLPAGTQVWIRAAWINAKQQAGPMSAPITANLPGGGGMAAVGMDANASEVKLAA